MRAPFLPSVPVLPLGEASIPSHGIEDTGGSTAWISAPLLGTSPAATGLSSAPGTIKTLAAASMVVFSVATAPLDPVTSRFSSTGTALPSEETSHALVASPAPPRDRRLLPSSDEDLFAWCVEASTSDLWRVIHAQEASVRERAACMSELAERSDAKLPSFVVQALDWTNADPRFRDALLATAEVMQVSDPALRERLEGALLRVATMLRDRPELSSERSLWAAVRRYASLVPQARVSGLLAFLRSADALTTRQVALQGTQNVFSVEPPGALAPLSALRERVRELALKYLDADWLVSPENNALALNAFCASAAAGEPELMALTDRLCALGKPRLRAQAAQKLEPIAAAWRARLAISAEPSEALLRLEASLTVLALDKTASI